MTGEEEDILAAPKIGGSEKMSRIIGNCLVKVGTIEETKQLKQVAKALPIGDRAVILLALRSLSLEDLYKFKVKCPACDQSFNTGILLSTLEVTFMGDKKIREHKMTLKSGTEVVLKVMTGEDEARLEKQRKSMPRQDALSMAILARLKSVNGNEKPSIKDMKRLTFRDRQQIRNWYTKVEGGVNTDIDVGCENCGHEFQTMVDIGQPAFFFPPDSEE
jgi:hypothetical protein